METYIWKLILCSSVLLGLYHLLLEGQKTHRFNRIYLICSLFFSALVPLMSITYGIKVVQPAAASEFIAATHTAIPVKEQFFTLQNIIYLVYTSVTLVLLFKFFWNIYRLNSQIKHSEKHLVNNSIILLLNQKIEPHSFWNYIFLNKSDYEEGKIDPRIIIHEASHIKQKHSVDLIVIELFLTFLWFNPAFYLYKKAILNNHEFLADEAVLKSEDDIQDYQKLVLQHLVSENTLFTNSFNINNTKKRLKMMTTPKKPFEKLISLSTLPITALLFFAFVNKVPAQIIAKQDRKEGADIKTKATSQERKEKKVDTSIRIAEKAKVSTAELNTINAQTKSDTIRPKKAVQKVNSSIEVAEPQQLTPKEVADLNQVSDITLPEYPGGLGALRQAIAQKFDMSKMANKKGTFSGVVWINIPKNFAYPDLFFDFKDEDFMAATQDAVKNAMTEKWKPALKDGQPVDYTYKLPITMSFK